MHVQFEVETLFPWHFTNIRKGDIHEYLTKGVTEKPNI